MFVSGALKLMSVGAISRSLFPVKRAVFCGVADECLRCVGGADEPLNIPPDPRDQRKSDRNSVCLL